MSVTADLDKIREVAAKTTAGEGSKWFVQHAATKDGLSRIDDGRQEGMFPIYGEAHDIELAALCVNFVVQHVLGRVMTEEELDLLHGVKDKFWHDFSDLVNRALARVPAHLRENLEMALQESSSVYGRRTGERSRDDG